MKYRTLLAISTLTCVCGYANAGDATMEVSKWYAGCEASMSTNHFDLAPGATSEAIFIDMSACTDQEKGSLMFFGYKTAKTRSRQLTTRDNVRLTMTAVDPDNEDAPEMVSDDGSAMMEIAPEETGCWLYAENLNKRKTLTLRLRSHLFDR